MSASKSTIQKRQTVVTRSNPQTARMSMGGGGMVMHSTRKSFGAPLNLTTGTVHSLSRESVGKVKNEREKERHDMQGLNDRFCKYIQKVGLLEAENKQLAAELEKMRNMKAFPTEKIREIFENQIKGASEELESVGKIKAELDSKILGLEDELESEKLKVTDRDKDIENLNARLEKQNSELASFDGEISLLQRNNTGLDDENKRLKLQIKTCQNDIKRLREDLTEATTAQLKEAEEATSLEEQLQFLEHHLETENEELRKRLAQTSNIPEIKGIWEDKLSQVVTALRQNYEDEIGSIQTQLEMQYDSQLRTIQAGMRKEVPDKGIEKEETRRVKSQLGVSQSENMELNGKLDAARRQLEDLQRRYQDMDEEYADMRVDKDKRITELENELLRTNDEFANLSTMKLSLDVEIAMYRKLLDGQEQSLGRVVNDITQAQSKGGSMLSDIIQTGQSQSSSSTGSINITRSNRGKIAFAKYDSQGKSVTLENTSKQQPAEIGAGWKILRYDGSMDEDLQNTFVFENSLSIGSEKSFKVYGARYGSEATSKTDQIMKTNRWYDGSGKFVLQDANGSEKASMHMKFR